MILIITWNQICYIQLIKISLFTRKSDSDIVNPVQSARIESTDKYGITMGSIIEVRAQMPMGDWLLPGVLSKWCARVSRVTCFILLSISRYSAIVMLPINSSHGKWPKSGEIDIVQVRSNAYLTCNGALYGRQRAESSLIWQSGQNILNIHNRHK